MKITIVGSGYVGTSNGVLLSQHSEVCFLDTDMSKVDLLNNKKSPIKDSLIDQFLISKELNYSATTDKKKAYKNADYVIICVPTNYDEVTGYFDVSILKNVVKECLEISPSSNIVIKSTTPIGFTASLKEELKVSNIIFSPEFLREGKALYDNLYPSRIIMGEKSRVAQKLVELLKQGSLKSDIPILYMRSNEAEAVKLFANAYLAMRVAYFNELDMYAESCDLNTQDIIKGVCLDPRIGDNYNNPSFGYGGYCLSKDAKQLENSYLGIPNNLISAIVRSNETRKEFITNQILSKKPKVIGIYRLVMKKGSSNFRKSAVFDIISKLSKTSIKIFVYEPLIGFRESNTNFTKVDSLETFKEICDLIICNRKDNKLVDVKSKIYTRDLFGLD